MSSLRQQLLEVAEHACNDSGVLTTAQMKEVLKLVFLGVQQTNRMVPKATESLWKADSWKSLIEKVQTSPRLKSSPVLLKLCERIAYTSEGSGTSINGQSKKASKRKAEEPEAALRISTKKKHKSGS